MGQKKDNSKTLKIFFNLRIRTFYKLLQIDFVQHFVRKLRKKPLNANLKALKIYKTQNILLKRFIIINIQKFEFY